MTIQILMRVIRAAMVPERKAPPKRGQGLSWKENQDEATATDTAGGVSTCTPPVKPRARTGTFGTYRRPDAGQTQRNGTLPISGPGRFSRHAASAKLMTIQATAVDDAVFC